MTKTKMNHYKEINVGLSCSQRKTLSKICQIMMIKTKMNHYKEINVGENRLQSKILC